MEPKSTALSERLNALPCPLCIWDLISTVGVDATHEIDIRLAAPAPPAAPSSPYCTSEIDTVVMHDFSLRNRDWVPQIQGRDLAVLLLAGQPQG
jgi:hypothetical protein